MTSLDLLITFALPEESSQLRRRLAAPSRVAVGQLYTTSRAGMRFGLFHTGMGGAGAAARLRELLENVEVGGVLISGFAAGLREELGVADWIFDGDAATIEGVIEGLATLQANRTFTLHRGNLKTVRDPIESVTEKRALAAGSNAIAVDMETADLMEVAREFQLPCLTLRSVSDRVDEDLPVPLEVWFDMQRQQPRVARLLIWLARHPSSIPAFTTFVRNVKRAGQSLAIAHATLMEQWPTREPT